MTHYAIFAADSLEGKHLLEALGEWEAAPTTLRLYSAAAYDAEPAMYRGRPLDFRPLDEADFSAVDVAVFMPGEPLPQLVDAAESAGCVVVDAANVLSQRGDVPVFCAGTELAEGEKSVAIADAVSSHVYALLAQLPTPQRIDLAVAQPVSSAGSNGVETLAAETARLLNAQSLESSQLPAQIAFNVLPLTADNSADIEHNLATLLTQGRDEFAQVHCQAMLAPVFYGHCTLLRAEFGDAVAAAQWREQLLASDGFRLRDGSAEALASPAGLQGSETIDIAEWAVDRRDDRVLRATIVADNLRKGAALNIIEALKILIKTDT